MRVHALTSLDQLTAPPEVSRAYGAFVLAIKRRNVAERTYLAAMRARNQVGYEGAEGVMNAQLNIAQGLAKHLHFTSCEYL